MNLDLSLLPYYSLSCPNQKEISSKVLTWLQDNTNLLDQESTSLWNKINTVDLLKAVPEINEYFKTLDLRVREIAFTMCYNNASNIDLHIDELPVVAKINFPIQNTEGTFNEWYNIPQDILDTYEPIVNEFDSEYYELDNIDLSKCELLASIVVDHPIVFNSRLPHRVSVGSTARFPRIVMSCTFFKEPIGLLARRS